MSNNSTKQKCRNQSCWEEAGGEFYQENYSVSDADLDPQSSRNFSTLLPSKQTLNEIRTYRKKKNINYNQTINLNRNTTQELQISIMPDLSENLPSEKRTYEDLKNLRSLPLSMHDKREMRKKLQNTTYIRLKGCKKFRWSLQKSFKRSYQKLCDLLRALFDFWVNSIEEIERSHGIVLAHYFLFLKRLLILNVFLFLPILVFLIIPNTIFYTPTKVVSQCNDDFVKNNTHHCCLINSSRHFDEQINTFRVQDILTGNGVLAKSFFFYGFYENIEFFQIPFGTYIFIFSTPLILISILIKNFSLSIIFSLQFILKHLKKYFIERDNIYYKFSTEIFASWNLSLTNEELATLKKEYIFYYLHNLLRDSTSNNNRKKCDLKLRMIIFTFIYNCFFILIIIIEAIFYFYLFKLYLYHNHVTIFSDFIPVIIITVLNDLLPFLLGKITKLKTVPFLFYSVAIRLVPLTLFWTLLIDLVQINNCSVFATCWETYIGQFFYRLSIVYLIYQILILLIIDVPRKVFHKCFNLRIFGGIDLKINQLLLDLFYLQILCWTGLFFIPILAGLMIPILFILFYIKRASCCLNFPSRIHYSHRIKNLNFIIAILLTISLMFSFIIVISYIFYVPISQNCGPFRGYVIIWDYVNFYFRTLPIWLQDFLGFFSTLKFLVCLLVIFACFLFYLRVIYFSQRKTIESLKQQLFIEGQDKQFLLDRLNSLIRRQDMIRKKAVKKTHELKVTEQRDMTSAST